MAELAPSTVIRPPTVPMGGHTLLDAAWDLAGDGPDAPRLEGEDWDPTNRWESGFQFFPDGCDDGTVWAPCDPTPVDLEVLAAENAAVVEWQPLVYYAGFTCSTWGMGALNYTERAKRRLSRVMPRLVEDEFWRGDEAQAQSLPNQYLADATTLVEVDGGTAQPLDYALGMLQQRLGDCLGGDVPGVIHAPRRLVSLWAHDYLVLPYRDPISGRTFLFDTFGNQVVAGAGYDGSGPDGLTPTEDDTTMWAYATGPVYKLVGDQQVYADRDEWFVDRATNTATIFAQQTVAVVWDGCCHFGVNVDLCNTCCETPEVL